MTPLRAFLSFASEESAFAHAILRALREREVEVWSYEDQREGSIRREKEIDSRDHPHRRDEGALRSPLLVDELSDVMVQHEVGLAVVDALYFRRVWTQREFQALHGRALRGTGLLVIAAHPRRVSRDMLESFVRLFPGAHAVCYEGDTGLIADEVLRLRDRIPEEEDDPELVAADLRRREQTADGPHDALTIDGRCRECGSMDVFDDSWFAYPGMGQVRCNYCGWGYISTPSSPTCGCEDPDIEYVGTADFGVYSCRSCGWFYEG